MPLTDKYLKYKPEITFEIFEKVWNKLIECGWTENSNRDINYKWNEFSGKYSYFSQASYPKQFNTYSRNFPNYPETTVEEILGYDPFIKSKKQAVHCTTQEEWDFVLSKFNPRNLLSKHFNIIPGIITKTPVNAICTSYFGLRDDSNIGICSNVSSFKDYQILSFKEWCDQNNYSMEKDWTKASKEELLKEAKRRYTNKNFYCAQLNNDPNYGICNCTSSSEIVYGNEHPVSIVLKNSNGEYIQNTRKHISCIYYDGKWAEIISLPEEKVEEKSKFEVGKWYKNLGYDKSYIAKATEKSKLNGNTFYHGDYITNDKNFVYFNDTGYLQWNSETVEVDLSEIQQYLPEDHPDKIKLDVLFPELKVDIWDKMTKSDKTRFDYCKEEQTKAISSGYQIDEQFFKNYSLSEKEIFYQSESIFPKFEVPKINIKEETINKDYFPKFKDPYIK